MVAAPPLFSSRQERVAFLTAPLFQISSLILMPVPVVDVGHVAMRMLGECMLVFV